MKFIWQSKSRLLGGFLNTLFLFFVCILRQFYNLPDGDQIGFLQVRVSGYYIVDCNVILFGDARQRVALGNGVDFARDRRGGALRDLDNLPSVENVWFRKIIELSD